MNMYIDEDKFREIISALDKEIKNLEEIYSDINMRIKIIDGTDPIWKGRTQKAVYSYYEEIASGFNDTVKKFKDISIFLNRTLENHLNSDKSINESVDSNVENLDVNQ